MNWLQRRTLLVPALTDRNKDFTWNYFVRHLGGAEPPFEFRVKSNAEYLQAEIMGAAGN